MRILRVYLERNGIQEYIGKIAGNSPEDACFSYSASYLRGSDPRPISISLPLQEQKFAPDRTSCFFDGLLPEGFTRMCVAGELHAAENDYLSILAGLGNECLGAVRILEEGAAEVRPDYRELSLEEVRNLAREGAFRSAQLVVKSHLSLTGASGKVGLYFDEKSGKWFQPLGNAPGTHIVKQSHVRLEGIVANEQLCLLTASKLGIETPESFVIHTGGSKDADVLFAARRYDRMFTENPARIRELPVPYRLHQEDLSQALGIPAYQKYEQGDAGYLRKIFHLIRAYSAEPMADMKKLWDICVFNYLIGNTDNHIKNLSFLYDARLKSIRLAPAYDMISTVVYESSTREMSLSIGGKYEIGEIGRLDFEKEARADGLGAAMAMRRFDTMADKFESALTESAKELEEEGFKAAEMMKERILSLSGII